MQPKNYRQLWMGTIAATLTLLLSSYIYFNLMTGVSTQGSDWVYKFLYSLVFAFGLCFLLWKTKRIGGSHWVTALTIGLIAGVLIVVAARLVYFQNSEAIVCCRGFDCWVWIGQTMLAAMAAVAASDGKTGGGSDD